MKRAVATYSFHRHLPNTRGLEATGGMDLAGLVRLLREEFGADGIEPWSAHVLQPENARYVAEMAERIEEAGLEVVNVACDAAKVGLEAPADRNRDLAILRGWIATAADLGSRAIRINTAAPGDRTIEETLEAVVADYRECVRETRKRGLTVLLENHGGLSSDPAMIPRLFEEVDGGDAFAACPDNGNFPPEALESGLAAMIPHMAMAHLKVREFDAAGRETAFDIPALVRRYRENGFDGPLSIEFEGSGDAREGVAKGLALAREGMSPPHPA